jgi:RND family efflux transporter MFP subunit
MNLRASLPPVLAVLVFAGLVPAAAGCGGTAKAPKEDARSRPAPVRIEPVGRADLADVLRYGATLEPSLQVKLYTSVADRVLSYPWKDGDEIRRGDVIATVRREGMQRGMDQLAAQVSSLDAQLANLESEVRRADDLFAKGVMTQQVHDQLKTSLQASQAQRKALLASRGQIEATAANAVVRAPFSGVLAGKSVEEGDFATPMIPLGRLMLTDPLKVVLRLVERDVARVATGMQVRLALDAWPDRPFTGTVVRIAPYLDPATRTNTVEVSLENPRDPATGQRMLKPGMYGVAELVVDRRANVVVAPEAALLLDDRLLAAARPGEVLRRAFVVDAGGVARERTVRLGARSGSRYEVLDGLAEGERLVVRGQHGLSEGRAVEVVGAPEAPAQGGGR